MSKGFAPVCGRPSGGKGSEGFTRFPSFSAIPTPFWLARGQLYTDRLISSRKLPDLQVAKHWLMPTSFTIPRCKPANRPYVRKILHSIRKSRAKEALFAPDRRLTRARPRRSALVLDLQCVRVSLFSLSNRSRTLLSLTFSLQGRKDGLPGFRATPQLIDAASRPIIFKC